MKFNNTNFKEKILLFENSGFRLAILAALCTRLKEEKQFLKEQSISIWQNMELQIYFLSSWKQIPAVLSFNCIVVRPFVLSSTWLLKVCVCIALLQGPFTFFTMGVAQKKKESVVSVLCIYMLNLQISLVVLTFDAVLDISIITGDFFYITEWVS